MRYLIGCVCSSLLGAAIVLWLQSPRSADSAFAQQPPRPFRQPLPPTPVAPVAQPSTSGLFNSAGLSPEEAINVSVYEKANRSVVHITTRSSRVDGMFFVEVPEEGSGSGSIIDAKGHILTNYHVIENARHVAVTTHDGQTHDATFVGADPLNDIAVIRIDPGRERLQPVSLTDSASLRVGMRVFALGNPFGLERTLTTGIISSLNRSLQIRENRTIKQIIQTDAAINPGSSGGPLLDSHGRLIGMNTAIASRTGQSAGVGFAIPSNLIARVVPQLIEHGRVIRPDIGIHKVYETEHGLLIARLVPDGPADRVGLRGPALIRQRRGPFVFERVDRSAADMIVGVDGQDVKSAEDFLDYIERKRPGDIVKLMIIRQGEPREVEVRLGGGAPPENRDRTPL